MEINFFFVFKNNDMFIDYFILKSHFGFENNIKFIRYKYKLILTDYNILFITKIIFFAFPITFFTNVLIKIYYLFF
jgi:hypothetical protein